MEKAKLRFSALIDEYKIVSSEIESAQQAQRTMVGYVLVSLGIGLPILLSVVSGDTQSIISQYSIEIVIAILAGYGFVLSFLALSYIGLLWGIMRLSNYLLEQLAPRINEIASKEDHVLFQWQKHARLSAHGLFETIGFSLSTVGVFALIFVPSCLCFFGAVLLFWHFQDGTIPLWFLGLVVLPYGLLGATIVFFAVATVDRFRKMPGVNSAEKSALGVADPADQRNNFN